MAPRVRFLQKAQKKILGSDPEKEEGKDGLLGRIDHPEEAPSSLSSEEVEKCKALVSDTVTFAGEETRELSRKDNETEGDVLLGESESEEEQLMCKDLKTPSVQFFEDDEDDDAKAVDVLTVKRRNVFGLEPRGSVALVSAF